MNGADRRTLLLVEDEVLIAQAERLALEGGGYNVLIARSGEQAIETVHKTPVIDLVLMDIDLGAGIDGAETAAQILKHRDLPIVFLSSHTEPDIVEKVERIASYGYVVKDSSYAVLHASIHMAFRLFAAKNAVREKESLLLSMAENYPNSYVSIIERDLRVGFASGQQLKKQKLDPAQFIGKTPEQVFGEQAPVVRENYERTFQGEECAFELLMHGHHKSFRTVPLYADDGIVTRILAVAEDVTQRKQAEEHIRLSHETYKGLINSVTEAIYVQDEEGVFLDINDRSFDFYGIPREEVVGRTPEFLSAEGKNDLTQLGSIHKRAFDGEPQTIEFWGKRADGTPFPKEVTLSPGTYFGQKVVIAVARDITARKKSEQELRERTQLLRDVTQNMLDAVVMTDTSGAITFSTRAVSILGYTPEALLGMDVLALVHPDDLAMAGSGFRAMVLHGGTQRLEFRYRCADGSYLWFEVIGRVLPADGGGIPVRCIFSGRDVSERRQVNEDLRRSEANLKAIFENSLESIWSVDTNYNLLYVNDVFARAYFQTFGIHLKAGMNKMEFLPEHMRDLWKERYDRAFSGEHSVFLDTIEIGTQCVYIEVAMNPVIVDGTVVGASFYGKDITEKTLAEARIGYETRLRELLIGLSSEFINLPLNELNSAVRSSLAKLGEFVGADRAYVFDYDRTALTGSNTFEWCRDGIEPQINALQNVPFSMVDPWVLAHDRGERVHVASTKDLPPSSHRELLEVQGIKSLLTIPLIQGAECVGFVGFDSVLSHHLYSSEEQELLHVYAEMLVNVMERQDAEKNRRESEEKHHRILSLFRLMSDTMPDLLWAKDRDKKFLFANKAMCQILLNARDTTEPLGKTDMFFAARERESHPADPTWHTFGELCVDSDAITLKEMKEMQFDEYGNVKGRFLYLDVHKAPLLGPEGELIGVVGSARDITERKRAEQKIEKQLIENELLLKEVHHRIKNNITSIASLLTMQSRSVTNPEAVAILQDAIARVGSMKVLYERLLKSTHYESASVKTFVESLVQTVVALFSEDRRIRIETRIDEFDLTSKKLFPFGILITELLTNAMKYAFVGRDSGEIQITITRGNDQVTMTMWDNGIGLPVDFDLGASEGFGLLLIKVLSEQLDGTLTIDGSGGTRSVLTFGC